MSVMRRPLIFRRPLTLFGLSGLEPFRYLFDARTQRSNFLLLAKHDVAQLGVRSFEERNLGLDLLQRLIVHTHVPQNVCNTRSSGRGGLA